MSQNLVESRTEPVPSLSESNVHRRPPRASGSRAGTNDVLAEASDDIGVDELLLEPSARNSTEFGQDRANPLGEIDMDAGHVLNPPAFRFRRQCTFPWFLESFLCTSATLCFTAVMLIIHMVNGRQPPDWHLGQLDITVNALVSLATEFAKMSMSASVENLLSQLKWLWFVERPRKLIDLQAYDDAARGPWGSTVLLAKRNGSLLARFSALYILTSLLTAPFTQQSLGLETSSVALTSEVKALLPITSGLSRWNGSSFEPYPYDRTALLQATLSSAFVQNNSVAFVNPQCPTADCDWPAYGSLGICSGVKNITSFARNSTSITTLAKAKIASLYNSSSESVALIMIPERYSPTYVVVSNFILSPTGAFDKSIIDTMTADLFIAYSNEPLNISAGFDGDLSNFHYLELALYWCTKSYSTTVRNGTAMTVEISQKSEILSPRPMNASTTLNNFFNVGFIDCYNPSSPPCQGYGGTEVVFAPPEGLPPESQSKFWVDLWTALAISFTIDSNISGGILQTAGLTVYAHEGDTALALSTALFGDRMGLEAYPPEVQLQNIRQTVANIARGISNALRLLPPTPQQQSVVIGTAYIPQVIFTVRWPWLLLVSCQLVLTWILFIRTMQLSRRLRLDVIRSGTITDGYIFQRSQVLPQMFSNLEALSRAAKNIVVRLWHENGGRVLKLLVVKKPPSRSSNEIEMLDLEQGIVVTEEFLTRKPRRQGARLQKRRFVQA